MKSKKKKKVFGGCRDLISGLPDALICHILSFLPTKEAASTAVLAKRWKPLLPFVPNLDFDDSIYFHPRERKKNSTSFMDFVDSILTLQANANSPPLNRFHLKCKDVVDESRVLEWIPNVLKRGVSDLDVYISSSWDSMDSSFYTLPPEVYVSKTLVRLRIGFKDGVGIDVEGDVSLPKLKILHLDHFQIKKSMFAKLLSGCHALEELVLVNLMWHERRVYLMSREPCYVTVSIPRLKRLKFFRSRRYDEANRSVSLSFDNPNLVYLEYSDTIADRYQQVSFDSLVEASLRLRITRDQILKAWYATENYLEPKERSNVTKLLMGIRNVKILYLSDDTLEVLGCCRDTIPVFRNLIQLTIKTAPDIIWKSLPTLLKNCPNLVTLVFEGLHHKHTNRCDEDEDGCLCKYRYNWGGEMDVRTCLSSSPVKVLKILKFGETFDDDDDAGSCDEIGYDIKEQIKQVKYFLETMPDLEQMILYYNTPNDEDVMKLCKKLQKLRRVASTKCNVQIISDNLSLSSTMSTKRGRRRYISGFKNLR